MEVILVSHVVIRDLSQTLTRTTCGWPGVPPGMEAIGLKRVVIETTASEVSHHSRKYFQEAVIDDLPYTQRALHTKIPKSITSLPEIST